MVDEARPNSTACPDLEQWSAYVEASVEERMDSPLGEHLSRCDHCFSTVAALEQSLSSTDEAEQEVTPPDLLRRAAASGMRPARRLYWYAAAALAVILLGSWYANRQERDNLIPAGEQLTEQPVTGDGVFGFAGKGEESVSGQLHSLVVFAGFGEGESSAPPGWGEQELTGAATGVLGTVLPRRYTVASTDSLASFTLDILRQVDGDVDLQRFDKDDDSNVDYVFLVLSPEAASLLSPNEVRAGIGIGEDFHSSDPARNGGTVRIRADAAWGCVVREGTMEQTATAMAKGYRASMDTRR